MEINTLGETSSTIYKVRWYERPVIDEMANKWVVFKADDISHCTNEIIPKIQAAYDGTYGKGIDPSAVKDLLRALIWLTEETGPNEDEAPSSEAISFAKTSIEKAQIK
jgi:hypothetical protein